MENQIGPRLKTRPAIALLLVLAGLLSSSMAFSQTVTPAPAPTLPGATVPPPTAQSREEWGATMLRTPSPKAGCFTSAYPSTEWKEVPCATPLPRPYPPAGGPRPQTVGNGTDWIALSLTPTVSTAIGSFDRVSGVTSVIDSGTGHPDTFSLQLNTNP